MAKKVVEACEKPSDFKFIYKPEMSPKEKMTAIAKEIYGADGVDFTPQAEKDLELIHELGKDDLTTTGPRISGSAGRPARTRP